MKKNENTPIVCSVHFGSGRRGKKILRKGTPQKDRLKQSLPRITRLMALAIKFEDLLSKGLINDYAELARIGHADRSLITRLMNLRLLAPDIQEQILELKDSCDCRSTLKDLLPATRIVSWEEQRAHPSIQALNTRQRA